MSEDATPLDRAHAAMAASPDDDAARLAWFAELADAELFLWLEAEPQGSTFAPRVFDLADGRLVQAFDREDRLSGAAGGVVPYAALPGRVIAQALAGQGVALGVNLGVASSAFLVPPAALSWLSDLLARTPVAAEARPLAFHEAGALPAAFLAALEVRLAPARGLAAVALLAGVDYADGRRGHLLAFIGADPAAEPPLARAASEALTFSGIEAGEIDVAFLAADHPAVPALLRVGRAFAMAAEPATSPAPPRPDAPPRLR